jgi:hypothetical protein
MEAIIGLIAAEVWKIYPATKYSIFYFTEYKKSLKPYG